MNNESEAWDKDYSQRGALWSGAVHHLPAFPPGARVLELGCGNGKSLTSMCQREWDVTAIDFSFCAVKMCKPIIDAGQNGSLCVADVRSLPFAPEVFDGVIATHVLSHMQGSDRLHAASEAARTLAQGGTLYFSGFSTEDFRSGKGIVVEPGTIRKGPGICTHYFTEPEVLELFCTLTLQSITTKRWSLRVRGQEYPRAEVQATFIK
ncbi:MAG: class I SAM-dependent methyltransferase [Methanoregula sp.]|nr:class I SAM-dependent methyltransferase [Methanoregula sp.]